jgi:hypothetical protein
MCQARFVRATGVRINERGMLIVETDDAKLPHVVVSAADYPKLECPHCDTNFDVIGGCSKGAHDIMTEDAIIPLDFKKFPELRKQLDEMVDGQYLMLGKLHAYYVKEDIR